MGRWNLSGLGLRLLHLHADAFWSGDADPDLICAAIFFWSDPNFFLVGSEFFGGRIKYRNSKFCSESSQSQPGFIALTADKCVTIILTSIKEDIEDIMNRGPLLYHAYMKISYSNAGFCSFFDYLLYPVSKSSRK